jgi:hypothetical protein
VCLQGDWPYCSTCTQVTFYSAIKDQQSVEIYPTSSNEKKSQWMTSNVMVKQLFKLSLMFLSFFTAKTYHTWLESTYDPSNDFIYNRTSW